MKFSISDAFFAPWMIHHSSQWNCTIVLVEICLMSEQIHGLLGYRHKQAFSFACRVSRFAIGMIKSCSPTFRAVTSCTRFDLSRWRSPTACVMEKVRVQAGCLADVLLCLMMSPGGETARSVSLPTLTGVLFQVCAFAPSFS